MRGKLWLKYFIISLQEKEKTDYPNEPDDDAEWTNFLKKVLENAGKKMNCHVVQILPEKGNESGEYLTIDAMFFDNVEYSEREDGYDPFVLPCAVVELENSYKLKEISYCLWKILCVRAPVKVLICYQKGKDNIEVLKKHLEKVIWDGGLMKGNDSDLLVIIGDEKLPEESEWSEYFNIFEWRSDRLERVVWPGW